MFVAKLTCMTTTRNVQLKCFRINFKKACNAHTYPSSTHLQLISFSLFSLFYSSFRAFIGLWDSNQTCVSRVSSVSEISNLNAKAIKSSFISQLFYLHLFLLFKFNIFILLLTPILLLTLLLAFLLKEKTMWFFYIFFTLLLHCVS